MNNRVNHHIEPELLVRFLSGEADRRERQQINQWINADRRNLKYFEELTTIWNASEKSGDFDATFLKQDWKKVREKIGAAKRAKHEPIRQRSFVFQIVRIAAIFICIVGFYFLFQGIYNRWPAKEIAVTSVFEIKTVDLPDGSRVYLNSNSKLTYPQKFATHAREVTLDGEAFFEVAKDENIPFLIKAGPAFTEVVGTSFNISTRKNIIVVTVLTGKILLYKDKAEPITLTVGQQGTYSDKGLKKNVNEDINFLSWKTNVLTFKNTPLSQVVRDLGRHYNKHIEIATDALEECTLTSTYQQQSLDEILNELKIVFSIQIEETNRTLIIKGEGCR